MQPETPDIAVPGLWQCLWFAAPFVSVVALWMLATRMDQLLYWFFPQWEWEKRLGWLNLRLQRRTEAILRGIGHLFHAVLAVALYGIVWGVQAIPLLTRKWTDTEANGGMAMRTIVLVTCLVYWLIYLGACLIPKLKNQYETEELEKYRAWQEQLEREQAAPARTPISLLHSENQPQKRPNRIGPGQ